MEGQEREEVSPDAGHGATRGGGDVAGWGGMGRQEAGKMSPDACAWGDRRRWRCRRMRGHGATGRGGDVAGCGGMGRQEAVEMSLDAEAWGDTRRWRGRRMRRHGATGAGGDVAGCGLMGRQEQVGMSPDAGPWSDITGGQGPRRGAWRGSQPERGAELTQGRVDGRCSGPQARSSVVEHYLDTVGVAGSTPVAPTRKARSSKQ